MLIKITKRENKGLGNEHLQFTKVMEDKNVRTGGVKMNEKNKKQKTSVCPVVLSYSGMSFRGWYCVGIDKGIFFGTDIS